MEAKVSTPTHFIKLIIIKAIILLYLIKSLLFLRKQFNHSL